MRSNTSSLFAVTLITTLLAFQNTALAADPGEINGVWSGQVRSLSPLAPPYFSVGTGPGPNTLTNRVDIIVLASNLCTGGPPCAILTNTNTIGLNISNENTLVKSGLSSVTFILKRKGENLTGTVTTPDGSTGIVEGVMVSSSFFLVSMQIPGFTACGVGGQFYSGSGAILSKSGFPSAISITGSGTNDNCAQEIISITLKK